MDYILVLAFLILVPLVVVFLGARRPRRAGGRVSRDHGLSAEQPAADQPTPGAGTVNQLSPERAKRIPPS